ncbi:hypothetical protein Tco_0599178 [Tanacetum coccineum]
MLIPHKKRAGKDFFGKITPLFDTMMVQASEEKQKSKRKQRKKTEVAHDETEHEESVPIPSNDPLPSGEDNMQLNDLMVLCTKLQKQVLDLEKAKSDQAIEIASLKKRATRKNEKKCERYEEKAKAQRKSFLRDTAELKKHLVIVKDDDIAIDGIPLATKPPVIVDYKLLKEGMMAHYQLIRADGSSKRYSSMIRLLQGIDREDLQTLWKLVKTKHGDLRPEDEHERVLWGDLKVMFELDIRSDVWRNLQGYKVTIWKLIDSCGVHFRVILAVSQRISLLAENMLLLDPFKSNFSEYCKMGRIEKEYARCVNHLTKAHGVGGGGLKAGSGQRKFFRDINKNIINCPGAYPYWAKSLQGQGEQILHATDKNKGAASGSREMPKEEQIPTPRAWRLYVGRETGKEGSGVEMILDNPEEKVYSYAIRLNFYAPEDIMDYEALLVGLVNPENQRSKEVQEEIMDATTLFYRFWITHLPKSLNPKAEALVGLASIRLELLNKEVSVGIKTRPTVEAAGKDTTKERNEAKKETEEDLKPT